MLSSEVPLRSCLPPKAAPNQAPSRPSNLHGERSLAAAYRESSLQPVVQVPLHSTGAASRLAALLLPQIHPVFSVVAPCQPGASPVSMRRGTCTTGYCIIPGQRGQLPTRLTAHEVPNNDALYFRLRRCPAARHGFCAEANRDRRQESAISQWRHVETEQLLRC